MERLIRSILVVGAMTLSGACGGGATSPSPAPALRVTAEPVPLPPGANSVTVFSLRVENTGSSTVDLTFPSSCQVLPYFLDRTTRQSIAPRGGGFACLTVITHRQLLAGQSFAETVVVASRDDSDPRVIVLPAGDYFIYARLEDQTFQVKSGEVPFSVR